MTQQVALPLLALAGAAWLVPWGLGRLLPEGIGWLAVVGALSTAILAVLAGAGFAWLYGAAAPAVWSAAPLHFAALSLRSAIVWGPIMVLSLANLPRGWRTARW